MVFMSMAGAVVMAVAVAQGFEQRALVFAAAYVASRIGRVLLALVFRLGQRAIPVLVSLAVSAVPWIVGALVDDQLVRAVLWALALAIDYIGYALSFRRINRRTNRRRAPGRAVAAVLFDHVG